MGEGERKDRGSGTPENEMGRQRSRVYSVATERPKNPKKREKARSERRLEAKRSSGNEGAGGREQKKERRECIPRSCVTLKNGGRKGTQGEGKRRHRLHR